MMIERQVKSSGKDMDGDITKLCNPGHYWSPVTKTDAIRHIESGAYNYYIQESGAKAYIHAVEVDGKKHLRSDPDASRSNNLDNLPDC